MRHIKIIKSISLIIVLFLITSCSNNSAMKPEDFKNKDNIVLNPEDNNELLSFRIQRNTRLAKRVYREYQFLEDHDNLQRTNLVDISYSY